jgi:uncharacterized protein (DUF305 family)
LAVSAVSVAALTLAGCDGDPGSVVDGKSKAQAAPSVIAPGGPGEAAETLSAEEASKRKSDDTPNTADFSYVHMMIEHHQQALTMSGLAPDRVGSEQVKRLAERISASQKPEIEAMNGWLENSTATGTRCPGWPPRSSWPNCVPQRVRTSMRCS